MSSCSPKESKGLCGSSKLGDFLGGLQGPNAHCCSWRESPTFLFLTVFGYPVYLLKWNLYSIKCATILHHINDESDGKSLMEYFDSGQRTKEMYCCWGSLFSVSILTTFLVWRFALCHLEALWVSGGWFCLSKKQYRAPLFQFHCVISTLAVIIFVF